MFSYLCHNQKKAIKRIRSIVFCHRHIARVCFILKVDCGTVFVDSLLGLADAIQLPKNKRCQHKHVYEYKSSTFEKQFNRFQRIYTIEIVIHCSGTKHNLGTTLANQCRTIPTGPIRRNKVIHSQDAEPVHLGTGYSVMSAKDSAVDNDHMHDALHLTHNW